MPKMHNRWRPLLLRLDRIIESDPHGKDAHEAGAKLDHGKPRLGLVLNAFSRALCAVGEVGTYGANKYTDNGWIEVPQGIDRYTDALYRHLMREAQGELNDSDTDLKHAAHAAWNALARLDLMLREDDAETQVINLLLEAKNNEETIISSSAELQHDAKEPRRNIKISGPERIIWNLLHYLGTGTTDYKQDD